MVTFITFFHGSRVVTVDREGRGSHVYHITPASSGRLALVLKDLHMVGTVHSRPTLAGSLGVCFEVWDV